MKKIVSVFLAVLMIALLIPFTVSALESPTPGTGAAVQVSPSDPNAGTVTKENLGGGKFHLKATPSTGHQFDGWDIATEGTVSYVQGDNKSPEIIIEVSHDANVTARFTQSSSNPGSEDTTSPETGDSVVLFVLVAVITLVFRVCLQKSLRTKNV